MDRAVDRLGLREAVVVRVLGGGAMRIVEGRADAPHPVPPRAVRAMDGVARSRRGVAVWRVGSPRNRDAMGVWEGTGVAPGAIVAARLTAPGTDAVDLLVGILGDDEVGGEAITATLAEVLAGSGRAAPPPVEPPLHDPRTGRLLEAGIELAGESALDDLLRLLLERARTLLDARYAALGVLDISGTAIERFFTTGIDVHTRARIGDPPRGRGVLGALLTDPRPLRLERIDADPRSCGFPDGHPTMTTFLGAPIAIRDRVFGNIYLTDKHGGPFTEDDERLLVALAAQAAAAIDNARRLESERLRVEELERLQREVREVQEVLARGMSEHRDLEDLLPEVMTHVRGVGGADCACAALVEGGELVVRVADPRDPRLPPGLRIAADLEAFAATLREASGHPVEVVEIRVAGEFVGALAAAGEEVAEDGARALLSAIASQLALAVANRRAVTAERDRAKSSAALQLARANERATAEGFRRAIRAQEAERSRIARELHDEAGQVLTAVALHLRVLEDTVDPGRRATLTELRREVADAATHLHELITELRPAALREHGLASAITQQAQRLAARTGARVDVELRALPDDLPEETQIALFRVVQEALTNVARHSGAGYASVTAARRGGTLRVTIEDDGAGFDTRARTARHGLAGIKERVGLLGGRLSVTSGPGTGTTVAVELDGVGP